MLGGLKLASEMFLMSGMYSGHVCMPGLFIMKLPENPFIHISGGFNGRGVNESIYRAAQKRRKPALLQQRHEQNG